MKPIGFLTREGFLLAITILQCALGFQYTRSLTTSYYSTPPSKLFASNVLVSIDENAARDIESMYNWATSCGVQIADGFELTISNDDGLHDDCGVTTTQDLAASQAVLMVPSAMILTGGKAQQELGFVQAAEELLQERMDYRSDATEYLPQFYLLLKILKEYEMGDLSPWYPWLNSLPRYFSNGSALTAFCTACLPPLVGQLSDNERIQFIQFFRALDEVDFLSDSTKSNKELASWAFSVVCTRGFPTGDGDVQIIPIADMLNHGSEPELEIYPDEEGNCYAYTRYDIPSGSPLRISYGDTTNPSFLFARYGFVDESAPATFCKIMIDHPMQQLINMGYDYSRMLFYKETGEVSPEVWDVMLYQILGEVNLSEQQSLYEAHMNGDYETKQSLHARYFSQTSASLCNHVDSFIADLDRLQQKTEGKDLVIHPRLPLIQKHNAFVKETFLTVKARLMEYT